MRLIRIAAAAALALLALPALASTQATRTQGQSVHPEAAAMCRAECLQTASTRLGSQRQQAAQACAVRCAAATSYLTTQTQRVSAEATGRGRDVVVRQAGLAVPATASQAIIRTSMPTAAAMPRPVRSNGVLYGARAPSAAFGLVMGEADRMTAHRLAERSCTAGGAGCRVLAEFSEACGAAAHGIRRSQWALFITSDPNSYVVTSLSAGSGASQAEAERVAITECKSRDPMAQCRVTASACGRG